MEPKTYGKYWDANQMKWVACESAEQASKLREAGFRFYGEHNDKRRADEKRADVEKSSKAKGTLPPTFGTADPAKK